MPAIAWEPASLPSEELPKVTRRTCCSPAPI
jgi:hypothetical protein